MKAVIVVRKGILAVVDIGKPEPKDHEILIKVHAATVTHGDALLLDIPSIFFPLMSLFIGYKSKKIPGTEFSGVVEAVGSKVTKYKPGDEVWGLTTKERMGGQAEFTVIKENGIISEKPKNIAHREAVTYLVGAMTAIQLLRKKDIANREKVMIYGASGSVGSFAVQIAKNHGATVTAVCSEKNIDIVKAFGADEVIDYNSSLYEEHDKRYDLVFDAVGKMQKADIKRFKNQRGDFASTMGLTKESVESLNEIRELVERGKLNTYIDRTYTLDEALEAYDYVKTGRKRGNIVFEMIGSS